jgi:GR25 family glycosyltransferase involved in LPS biosynthesis/glycosyltransferase involved in cell wall biosynthesis
MIVRDEAHIIRETLDSVAPLIDYWVIVDTGSTDATIETVRSHMASKGLPGEIHERPWRDFGANRTEALELCRGKADYIWVIDADDVVVGDLDLSGLDADSYLLRYGDGFRFWRRQIFRDGLRWGYKGVVHEYPVCLDPATEERLDGEYHIEQRRLGARSRTRDTLERDASLLREALECDPDDARSVFYLAQSYYDAGDCAQALEWYSRRAEMGGWAEEVFYSLLRRAACLVRLGEPTQARAAYLEAWHARPTRAEPLYEIALSYRLADKFELGYEFAKRAAKIPYPERDSLFIAADVYAWRNADELAICAYYTDRMEESFERSCELLEGGSLPTSERARVESNRNVCVPAIQDRFAEYPADLVDQIHRRGSSTDSEVTLTITSCRRPDLFERTVNSFLRCCTDVERIGRWICVDNGSANEDRDRMRELYPFFEFVYTDPARERHADSMNRLLRTVASPFWLHLEDDWQFFWRGAYVERALAILNDDDAIAQVAFNRNYGETVECQRIVGGAAGLTRSGALRYLVHEHVESDTPDWEQHLQSLPAGALTVAYWPHFTLRPSLMRTASIKSLGPFDAGPGARHFELEFARRYMAAGLSTAFFDGINCLHTGRLTSPQPGDGRVSAYELIGDDEHPAHPRVIETPSVVDDALEITVVNLDRRRDRWTAFQAAFNASAGSEFVERCRRFAAVDGRQLSDTPELRWLFRENDFGSAHGIVGCALSHLEIWQSLANQREDQLALVLEDDAQPCDRFDRRLAVLVHELRESHADVDIAFLGYLATTDNPIVDFADAVRLRPIRPQRYIGGCYAYLISGRGARKLVELAQRDGIQTGIDWFVISKAPHLCALECDPPLVRSTHAWAGNGVDSDIQHDFTPVARRPSDTRESDPDHAIKVRMLGNWCSSRELCEIWNRMTSGGTYGWNFRGLDGIERRLQMTSDQDESEEPDYWVVINAPQAADERRLDRSRTVVFHMEPRMWSEGMREQWGRWAAPSPRSFLQVRDHRRYRNSNDWWVGLTYSELRAGELPPKDRMMSACVSAKYFDPGHVRRLDFLRFLDDRSIELDIYGSPENGFRRGRGQTPPHDKSPALLRYRYYFDAENNSVPNYFTEKIVDCLLAETLCFYWGCPNLDSFFDPRAFIRLELDDFEADFARIRQAIADNEWSARLPFIRAEKQRILDDYSFFPTLARAIDPARRRRRWHIGTADRALVNGLIGERRCGVFVEVSDRVGAPEVSETLDVERRLDWSGLCLEADSDRARVARGVRDCTVVDDREHQPVEAVLARNGLSPISIDWLNLAVGEVEELIREGGRLDPARVRANLVSMPVASPPERFRAAARLRRFGYEPPPDSPEQLAPTAMVRRGRSDIYGFYHLCTINDWRAVLDEQVQRWAESGLEQATTRIFASVVGPAVDQGLAALAAACGERLEVIHMSEDRSRFERPILEFARLFCEVREPLARACWYMHAKGVSHERSNNVADWRRLMEHFTADRWSECAAALDEHDACGVNWQRDPAAHFSGNFWWARPRYLAALPRRIGPAPFDPESWIGTNQPHVLCLHDSGVDHYVEPYPPERYLQAV